MSHQVDVRGPWSELLRQLPELPARAGRGPWCAGPDPATRRPGPWGAAQKTAGCAGCAGIRPISHSQRAAKHFSFHVNRPPCLKTRFRLEIFRNSNTICSMKTTCSKCGEPNDRLPQRYCRACHAAYARDHRPRHVELPEDQRLRSNARAYANVYQRRGKLVPAPCSICHDPAAQKHHDDYSKPLQVRWLCRKCHLALHSRNRTLHVEPKLK